MGGKLGWRKALTHAPLVRLIWTHKALSDLARLHAFLAPLNPPVAATVRQSLTRGAKRLLDYPRIGEKLDAFGPREVRHIFVGDYEIRYEIQDSMIYILRLWHTREDR